MWRRSRLPALVAGVIASALLVAVATTASAGSFARGIPDLRPATLALADLPRGATITRDRATQDVGGFLAMQERSFGVGKVTIGSSRLTRLDDEVRLYPSDSGPKAMLHGVKRVLAVMVGVRHCSEGKDGPALTIDAVRSVDLGDEAALVTETYCDPPGNLRGVAGYARVGRILTTVRAVGAPGRVHEDDVITLLRRAAKRAAAVR